MLDKGGDFIPTGQMPSAPGKRRKQFGVAFEGVPVSGHGSVSRHPVEKVLKLFLAFAVLGASLLDVRDALLFRQINPDQGGDRLKTTFTSCPYTPSMIQVSA